MHMGGHLCQERNLKGPVASHPYVVHCVTKLNKNEWVKTATTYTENKLAACVALCCCAQAVLRCIVVQFTRNDTTSQHCTRYHSTIVILGPWGATFVTL